MKEFNWGKFKNHKIIVHCRTEKEAENFINKCIKHKITKWGNDEELDINYPEWEVYEEKTCYELDEYNKLYYGKKIIYGNNYKIFEWSDYMNKEFKKSDLKDGMVIETRNEDLYFVFNGRLLGKDKWG